KLLYHRYSSAGSQPSFHTRRSADLAIQLKHGALPVALEVESMSTVGATLGRESVEASLKAAVVGLVLVVLFMLAYYRLPGFLAEDRKSTRLNSSHVKNSYAAFCLQQ